MKWKVTNKTERLVDEQIASVLQEMNTVGITSDLYPTYLTYVERLSKINAKRRNPVSGDILAQIAGNLAGIFIIVAYEQKHVITSRAFGELIRAKSTSSP